MSAFRLDPRTVDPDNWKLWHRDALRLWWRLGLSRWLMAVGLPTYLVASLVDWNAQLEIHMLSWSCLLLALGYLLMPFQLVFLRQARSAGRLSLRQAWDQTMGGWRLLLGWIGRRLFFGSLVVGFTWGVVIALLAMFPNEDGRVVDGALTLLLLAHLTSYCWMVQARGIMDMGYFLEIQERVERPLARALQILGAIRNAHAMNQAMMTLIYGHVAMIFMAAAWRPIMLLLPWLSWHSAAVVLNAWHDIFDPDGGLAEVEKVAKAAPAQAATPIRVRR